MTKRGSNLVKWLDHFTPVVDLENDDHIPFEYMGKFMGNITMLKKTNETHVIHYHFYFTFHQPFSIPFGEKFILIFQHTETDPLLWVEKRIKQRTVEYFKKKRGEQSLTPVASNCMIYLINNENKEMIKTGQWTCMLYKQKRITDEKLLAMVNLPQFIQQKLDIKGCYLTTVNIDRKISTYSTKKKKYYTDRIIFSTDQKPPEGKNQTILIVENHEEFLEWVNMLTRQTEGGIALSRLVAVVLSYMGKTKSINKTMHPYYRELLAKNVVANLSTELTSDFLEKVLSDVVDKHIRLTHPLKLKEIMDIRTKTYTLIVSETGLDRVKLGLFLKDHQIHPDFGEFIQSNYTWYILNEAVELTEKECGNQHLTPSIEEKTDMIAKYFKRIQDFEDKQYSEEKKSLNL